MESNKGFFRGSCGFPPWTGLISIKTWKARKNIGNTTTSSSSRDQKRHIFSKQAVVLLIFLVAKEKSKGTANSRAFRAPLKEICRLEKMLKVPMWRRKALPIKKCGFLPPENFTNVIWKGTILKVNCIFPTINFQRISWFSGGVIGQIRMSYGNNLKKFLEGQDDNVEKNPGWIIGTRYNSLLSSHNRSM